MPEQQSFAIPIPANHQVCKACNKAFPTQDKAKQYCSPDCRRKEKDFACETCGKTFSAYVNRRCCSLRCYWDSKANASAPAAPDPQRRCETCDGVLPRSSVRFCNQECKAAKSLSKTIPCEVCSKPVHFCASEPRRFCSKGCMGVAHGERLRAQHATVPSKGASPREAVCKACGNVFRIRGTAKSYCSMECRYSGYDWPTKTCPTCKKEWKSDSSKRMFCSKDCDVESRKRGRMVTCEICPTTFYVSGSRQARYCSKKCTGEGRKRTRTEHICKLCKKTFLLQPCEVRDRMANGGVSYCSQVCAHADPERMAKILAFHKSHKQTKLETAGYAMLDAEGVVYVPQYILHGKFMVDAFVPSLNLVIEFDGDYWHANPAIFPNPTTNQKRWIGGDRAHDAYILKCGYRLLRIFETDMYKHTEDVRQRLRAALAEPAGVVGPKPTPSTT